MSSMVLIQKEGCFTSLVIIIKPKSLLCSPQPLTDFDLELYD